MRIKNAAFLFSRFRRPRGWWSSPLSLALPRKTIFDMQQFLSQNDVLMENVQQKP